jgi:hypothetical protein
MLAGTNILTTAAGYATALKSATNSWTGSNTFNDNLLYFRDTNHFVGGVNSAVNGPSLFGYLGVALGYSYPSATNMVIINNIGLTILSGYNLVIGAKSLTETVLGYLSGITSDVQTQINSLKSYSGQVIQMKLYQPQNNTLYNDQNSITSTNGQDKIVCLFYITTKSNNSQIYINFDCNWGVSNYGVDSWISEVFIKDSLSYGFGETPTIIAHKEAKYGVDNRNCSITLFPISGGLNNTTINRQYVCGVKVRGTSDDTLTINQWNMTITEIQN